MLVIRLFRVGRKNQPSFKVVVTDKRQSATAGRFVEEVGFYNPVTKEKVLKQDRIKYWLSVGAKPSNTIFNFFVAEKVIEGKKIPAHKKSKTELPPAEATVKMKTEFSSPSEKKEVIASAPAAEASKAPAQEKPSEEVSPSTAEVKPEESAKEEAKPATPAEQK